MKTPPPFRSRVLILGICATGLLCQRAGRAEEITAVASRVNVDYVRTRLPDGTFQPETYTFGKGGYMSGALNDSTIDKMDFMDVARTIAVPLAVQKYIPSWDAKATKLLIMVYWGTTQAPEHASDSAEYQLAQNAFNGMTKAPMAADPLGGGHIKLANSSGNLTNDQSDAELDALFILKAENYQRDLTNERNAALLGYNSWWDSFAGIDHAGTPMELQKQDMINELEEDRYFVVLMAYDFQMMWKEKKSKLLWETRFSISQHHFQFDKQLASMAKDASKYFGQDSHGLVRKPVPEGNVEVGAVRSLGEVPGK